MSMLLLLSGSGGGTAPSLSGVQAGGDHLATGNALAATSASMTTTAGRGLVAFVVWQDNSASPTLTDSKSNGAWTPGTLRTWTQYGSPVYMQQFLLPAMATAGASHTVTTTHTGVNSFPTMFVMEVVNPGGTLGIDTQSFTTDSTSPYDATLTSVASDVLMLCETSPSNTNVALPYTGTATGWSFLYGKAGTSLWNLAAFAKTVSTPAATPISATYSVAQDAELHGMAIIGIKATSSVVSGTVAWTEANDTAALAGALTVSGTAAWTEANDAAALSGTATVSGAAAWTEANDAAALSGTVGNSVTGSIAWTEANDTAALTGTVRVSGTAAWTEANDAASLAGSATVTGTVAWTEANDAAALTGNVGTLSVSGTIAWTEADDTWSLSGTSAGSTVVLLGGGPGGPRKRSKGGTESYLERLLGRPLDEEEEAPEPEEIERIEQAVQVAAKAPEPPTRDDAAEALRLYGVAFREAYVRIYQELEAKRRQELEDEQIAAIIALCL